MTFEKSKKASFIFLVCICASCIAGSGIQKYYEYTQLTETYGTNIWNKELLSLGTNILLRCREDAEYLDKVCEIVRKRANAGDNLAALVMATDMYDYAPQKGEKLLLDLANNTDTDAMVLLAYKYYEDDSASAIKWLRQAAKQEDEDAILILTTTYSEDIPKPEVIRYLEWLVHEDNPAGLFSLAVRYLNGDGVEVDEKKAGDLLEKAWDVGYPEAGLVLALLYKDTDRELSLQWMEKGAKAGDRRAQYEWSQILLDGEYTQKRKGEGLLWLRKSAEAGYAAAQYSLGMMYSGGVSVGQNDDVALAYFLNAAEQGDQDAQFEAGMVFLKRRDIDNARSWFLKASAQGHTRATSILREIEQIESSTK